MLKYWIINIKRSEILKKEIRKFVAIALSSLGVLTSSPLAFCSGIFKRCAIAKPLAFRFKPIPLTHVEKSYYIYNKHDIFTHQYSSEVEELHGVVQAIYADSTVEEEAFLNQTKMQVIYLPEIKQIDKYAFKGCDSLKVVILTSSLERIHTQAFEECNPDLQIMYDKVYYSVRDFFTKIVYNNNSKEA